MAKRKNQPETNVEFVTRIMEFSNYGALAQLFVLESLRNWSDIVAQHHPAEIDMSNSPISAHAWVGVAKEIKAKLEERM